MPANSLRAVSPTDPQRPVFVYGTLRPGQPNWDRLLAGSSERVIPGRLSGVDLLDCGRYPAAVERPDAAGAVGEVVWVRAGEWPEVLAALDYLEGYDPADPNPLFERIVRSVDTTEGSLECWVYVAGRTLAEAGLPLVAGGDWGGVERPVDP